MIELKLWLHQNIKIFGCFYKPFINCPEDCIIILGNTQICRVIDSNILGKRDRNINSGI
jgi:hypothetical protein